MHVTTLLYLNYQYLWHQVLESAKGALLHADPWFQLELAFLVQNGEGTMATAVDRAIMKCFPSESKPVTFSQANAKLADLGGSKLAKMANRSSQRLIESVKRVVEKMMKGVPPDAKLMSTSSNLMGQVWKRLSFFAVEEVQKEDGTMSQVSGPACLAIRAEKLQAQCTKEERQPTQIEVEPFRAFRPFMNQAEVKMLDHWESKIREDVGWAASSAVDDDAADKKKKLKGRKVAAGGDTKQSVLQYFG